MGPREWTVRISSCTLGSDILPTLSIINPLAFVVFVNRDVISSKILLSCIMECFCSCLHLYYTQYQRIRYDKTLHFILLFQLPKVESFIKGRLNINPYIHQNLSRGNWHKLNCTYDALEIDNKMNRIIKYVSTFLLKVTAQPESRKYLSEILFILDEVADVPATADQCDRISFNPMFQPFETVRDYCKLFLTHSITFSYKNDLKLFAFLLPMEYVFEDFIFGFIDQHLMEISAKAQRRDVFLDEEKFFNLQPDLWLETPNKSLIADTKYKIIYSDENDPKKGIQQSDLYQMLAYAIRFGVDEVVLFYPDTIQNFQDSIARLIIRDVIADSKKIEINAYQLPIIHRPLFHKIQSKHSSSGETLKEIFAGAEMNLKNRIKEVLMPKITD